MPNRTRLLVGTVAMFVGAFGLLLGLVSTSAPALGDNDPYTVELKASQRNTVQTDPSYTDSDCGGLDPANGPVWHFVANNLAGGSNPVSFTAKFGPAADTVTETLGDTASARRNNDPKTTWQFFVQSTQPVLVDAVAVFDLQQVQDADMVLSHICGGTNTSTTTTEATTTSVQETTTSQATTTTEATTTTTEATTTTAATTTTITTTTTTTTTQPTTTSILGTSTTQATTTTQPTTTTTAQVLGSSTVASTTTTLPTEVQGEVIERLPRTGVDYGYLLTVASALLIIGGTFIYHSELRRRGLVS